MSVFFGSAIDAIHKKLIDLSTDDVRALLVDASYTVSAAHDFLNDVTGGARVGSAVALSGKTFSGGVFNCTSPITFVAPTSGKTVVAIVLYVHTGTESTSRLIAYLTRGYNLPLSTNGNNVHFDVDSGVRKLFRVRLVTP